MSQNTQENKTNPVNKNTHKQAAQVISSAVKWSAGGAIVPIPYIDLLAIATVQAQMVNKLAKIYGQETDDRLAKNIITGLLGALAPAAVSTALVGSSFKLLPGVGSILGSVSMAAFAAGSTYAIGKAFASHFANGGSLFNFDPDAIQEDLERDFAAAQNK